MKKLIGRQTYKMMSSSGSMSLGKVQMSDVATPLGVRPLLSFILSFNLYLFLAFFDSSVEIGL